MCACSLRDDVPIVSANGNPARPVVSADADFCNCSVPGADRRPLQRNRNSATGTTASNGGARRRRPARQASPGLAGGGLQGVGSGLPRALLAMALRNNALRTTARRRALRAAALRNSALRAAARRTALRAIALRATARRTALRATALRATLRRTALRATALRATLRRTALRATALRATARRTLLRATARLTLIAILTSFSGSWLSLLMLPTIPSAKLPASCPFGQIGRAS